jgi:hypothetical protein
MPMILISVGTVIGLDLSGEISLFMVKIQIDDDPFQRFIVGDNQFPVIIVVNPF